MTSSSLIKSWSVCSSFLNAPRRRSLYFPIPAASSNRVRLSSALVDKIASIIRFSITEYVLAPSPVSRHKSATSRKRHSERLIE